MNKTNLKRYAPQARKDFIAAVKARAQLLGLTEVAGHPHAEPCHVNGDVAVIAGRAWPAKVQAERERLLQRMKRDGYTATLDAVAYTWFNRFAALRYMELHDYLGHGRRVLSNPDGALPEVLSHALELAESGDLPGLQAEQVRQLKLDNQDGELFRRVLIAQCNALHGAMPFLFESIDDETELLLPDNLLLSDTVVAKLVSEIPEEDWTEVEAIGWLYQFYISEKKDEVIGKVVKSEDIPAATQLFTPNWIVQYLVQNSVGRLWLMANRTSTLASQWPYYIQSAEQTPEVQAQIDALIQTRILEDGEALNPESITVLDPACGSGHILVVAYDVLKAIYLERGYQLRAIPRLILEKNLYGLDIDDRAAQLAAFALLMKARADDRRLFNEPLKLNVLSLQESKGLDFDELAAQLAPFGLQREMLKALFDTFEHAKTFGSLIQISPMLNEHLVAMTAGLRRAVQDGDLYSRQAAKDILPLAWQASVMAMQFDAVAANPPYMGNKGMNGRVKEFLASFYERAKGDLYSAFIERGVVFLKESAHLSMVTLQTWMFTPAFEGLRGKIINNHSIASLVHIGYNSFPEINSKIARACAFCLFKSKIPESRGRYIDVDVKDQSADKRIVFLGNLEGEKYFDKVLSEFSRISGGALAYWLSESAVEAFSAGKPLEQTSKPVVGLQTGDNERFIRCWWEVDWNKIEKWRREENEILQRARWVPYVKGGDFRKWYGNEDLLIDWENDGKAILGHKSARPQNRAYYFRAGLSYTNITSGSFGVRYTGPGFIFDQKGSMFFSSSHGDDLLTASFLNSAVAGTYLRFLCSTLDFNPGDLSKIPLLSLEKFKDSLKRNALELISMSKHDWDAQETSRGFGELPLTATSKKNCLSESWADWHKKCEFNAHRGKFLEEENNKHLLDIYGFGENASGEVPIDQITLVRADREKDNQRLISYAVGCMMGRYSLDEPGLLWARAGNVGFDPSRNGRKFPADADGIVPVVKERWYEDDAAGRVREFLRAVWGSDTLGENMAWLAESLDTKGAETPDEAIRRYLADKFFKDHLQTYKKRPIYWLFSSGKNGAFQALVYLHRYHEGTLARMRSEYVLPLIGKMQARMESLEVDIHQASSTVARNKAAKQLEALRKQHHELLAYDEKLRHYADQRIAIDLDHGVKVNYGKFGDLLAEVKAVTGGAGDE